jgi:hypothetical protein
MAIIEMPQDLRQLALQQGVANWADNQYKQQQEKAQNDAMMAAAKQYQDYIAGLNQQNTQNQANYNNINDLQSQLFNMKNDAQKNWSSWTPEQQQMASQKADAVRNRIKSMGGPDLTGTGATQTADQMQAVLSPFVQQEYNQAITPAMADQGKLTQMALDAVKASHGTLPLNTAMQLGNMYASSQNQQAAGQANKFQAKHDAIIVNHLQNQFGDALKNKDYGTAAQLGMQLEQYGIKTPEWVSKMVEQPKPSGHVTLANGNLGLIMPDGQIQDTGQAVYIKPAGLGHGGGIGRATGIGSRGGVSRVGGFTPTQQRAESLKIQNAKAIMGAYDPNGKIDPTTGEYKPYTTAEQIKFNEASELLNANGVSVDNGSQSSNQQSNDDQAQAWRDRYNNVLADIANSSSDAERQQKVSYYEKNGELQQFRDSGLDPDNDIAYIGGANNNQQQSNDNNGGQQQDQGVSDVMQNFQNALNDEINQNGPDAARQWINDNRDYLVSQNIDPDIALTWIS